MKAPKEGPESAIKASIRSICIREQTGAPERGSVAKEETDC